MDAPQARLRRLSQGSGRDKGAVARRLPDGCLAAAGSAGRFVGSVVFLAGCFGVRLGVIGFGVAGRLGGFGVDGGDDEALADGEDGGFVIGEAVDVLEDVPVEAEFEGDVEEGVAFLDEVVADGVLGELGAFGFAIVAGEDLDVAVVGADGDAEDVADAELGGVDDAVDALDAGDGGAIAAGDGVEGVAGADDVGDFGDFGDLFAGWFVAEDVGLREGVGEGFIGD